MPRRELRDPQQVENWLCELGASLTTPGELILIGSGALLWHAAQRGIATPLPQHSMDVDPITASDEVIEHCYDAMIGSEFEQRHGWHVNVMPAEALQGLPLGWEARESAKPYALLHVRVPSPADLLIPKLKRNEPRDRAHQAWAREVGLLS